MKNKINILAIIPVLIIILIFSMSIVKVIENKNVGFDSQYIFTRAGYESIESKVKDRQEEYSTYISANQDRFNTYDKERFETVIAKAQKGDTSSLITLINDDLNKVEDKDLYLEDLKVVQLCQKFR